MIKSSELLESEYFAFFIQVHRAAEMSSEWKNPVLVKPTPVNSLGFAVDTAQWGNTVQCSSGYSVHRILVPHRKDNRGSFTTVLQGSRCRRWVRAESVLGMSSTIIWSLWNVQNMELGDSSVLHRWADRGVPPAVTSSQSSLVGPSLLGTQTMGLCSISLFKGPVTTHALPSQGLEFPT